MGSPRCARYFLSDLAASAHAGRVLARRVHRRPGMNSALCRTCLVAALVVSAPMRAEAQQPPSNARVYMEWDSRLANPNVLFSGVGTHPYQNHEFRVPFHDHIADTAATGLMIYENGSGMCGGKLLARRFYYHSTVDIAAADCHHDRERALELPSGFWMTGVQVCLTQRNKFRGIRIFGNSFDEAGNATAADPLEYTRAGCGERDWRPRASCGAGQVVTGVTIHGPGLDQNTVQIFCNVAHTRTTSPKDYAFQTRAISLARVSETASALRVNLWITSRLERELTLRSVTLGTRGDITPRCSTQIDSTRRSLAPNGTTSYELTSNCNWDAFFERLGCAPGQTCTIPMALTIQADGLRSLVYQPLPDTTVEIERPLAPSRSTRVAPR
jgi:hypothetical protein